MHPSQRFVRSTFVACYGRLGFGPGPKRRHSQLLYQQRRCLACVGVPVVGVVDRVGAPYRPPQVQTITVFAVVLESL